MDLGVPDATAGASGEHKPPQKGMTWGTQHFSYQHRFCLSASWSTSDTNIMSPWCSDTLMVGTAFRTNSKFLHGGLQNWQAWAPAGSVGSRFGVSTRCHRALTAPPHPHSAFLHQLASGSRPGGWGRREDRSQQVPKDTGFCWAWPIGREGRGQVGGPRGGAERRRRQSGLLRQPAWWFLWVSCAQPCILRGGFLHTLLVGSCRF